MGDLKKRPTPEAFAIHKKRKEHKRNNPLRDIILGGQDGLVNALGIILGILAGSSDIKLLIAAVLAATCAESLSMGAVAYTSALSEKAYYESEKTKEAKEIDEEPEMEREEIRQIFEQKGFKGNVLEEIVDTISSDKKLWIDTMMAEELGLSQIDTKDVLKSAVIVTVATAIGHIIPLMPFFFFSRETGLITAVFICGLTLFGVGVYQAVTLVGSWWKSGLRMLIIGLAAAFIGYFIAKLFHATA